MVFPQADAFGVVAWPGYDALALTVPDNARGGGVAQTARVPLRNR